MDLLNKILLWLFAIEFTLTIAYIYFLNRLDQWLYRAIINPNSPNSFTTENFVLLDSIVNLTFVIFSLLSIVLFFYALRVMRSRNIWFEHTMNFHFKNRILTTKLVGVLFLARYFIYMVNDFALIGNTLASPTTLSKFLNSHHLTTGGSFFIDVSTLKTQIAISIQFFADMIYSLLYAIIHFLVIVYIEFTSDKAIKPQENLYPENKEKYSGDKASN